MNQIARKKEKSPIALSLFAGILIAFIISFQIPVEIYLNNIQEYLVSTLSIFAILFTAFVIFVAVISSLLLFPSSFFRKKYSAVLGTVSLLVWFTGSFLFGEYGTFDGRGLSINTTSFFAIGELVVWGLLIALSLVYSSKIRILQYYAVTTILVLNILLTGYQLTSYFITQKDFIKNKILPIPKNKSFPESLLTFSTKGNVIHILVDELQSTIVEKLIEDDPSISEKLDGFKFFPNTAANYPTTVMAIPAMLSGRIYKNNMDRDEFIMEAMNTNNIITSLKDAGYKIDIHTAGIYCVGAINNQCFPIRIPSQSAPGFQLLDYALFRSFPDIIKSKIYDNENWLISKYFSKSKYSSSLNGVGHLLFRRFNNSIKISNGNPTYKLFHTLIFHSPLILDKNCKLRLAAVPTLKNRKEQAQCALKHIFQFIHKLKKLGVYHNTLIVLSSDHGSNYILPDQRDAFWLKEINPRIQSFAMASLFIKPLDSKGPLETYKTPASLSDIPNTVLETLGLPLLEHGVNLFSLSEKKVRPREFNFYNWSQERWVQKRLPKLRTFTIVGDIKNAESWFANDASIRSGVYVDEIDFGSPQSSDYLIPGDWSDNIISDRGVSFNWMDTNKAGIVMQIPVGFYIIEIIARSSSLPQSFHLIINNKEIGKSKKIGSSFSREIFKISIVDSSKPTFIFIKLKNNLIHKGQNKPLSLAFDKIRITKLQNIQQRISCGDTINFSKKIGRSQFWASGLSSAEPWGNWTIGSVASIEFFYQFIDCESVSLNVEVRAFVNSKNPTITSSLLLNGKFLGELNFDHKKQGIKAKTFSFDIPNGSMRRDNLNLIEFKIKGAKSPSSLGLSEDKRVLGLGLVSLSLNKLENKE